MRPRRAPGREPKLPPQKLLRKYRQDQKKPETLARVSGMLNATSPSQEDALSVHRDASRPGFHTTARRSDVSGETSGETPNVPGPRSVPDRVRITSGTGHR